MAATTMDPIVPGAGYPIRVSMDPASTAAYVPSDNRVLLILDSPKYCKPVLRITREYVPGGPNPTGVSAAGDDVEFLLSPTDTAAMSGYAGVWTVTLLVGASGAQYTAFPVGWTGTVVVAEPPGGTPPYT